MPDPTPPALTPAPNKPAASSRFGGIALVAAGLLVIAICLGNGYLQPVRRFEFVGTPVSLGTGVTEAVDEAAGTAIPLTKRAAATPGQESASCTFTAAADRTITIVHDGAQSVLQLRILGRGWFVFAAGGVF